MSRSVHNQNEHRRVGRDWSVNCNPRGLSLVETLAVVGVLGVLIAIAIPVLRSARAASEESVSMARCRECVMMLQTQPSSAERFPMGNLGGPLYNPLGPTAWVELSNGDALFFPWFAHSSSWNWAVVSLGEPVSEAWISPSRRGDVHGPMDSDYRLTHAVMAARSHWTRSGEQSPSMWGGQLIAGLARPASKVLIWESGEALRGRVAGESGFGVARPLGFADGHVENRNLLDAREGVYNRFIDYSSPLLTTEHGTAGWDY